MALDAHPTEVRADLQRFYGLNLDDIGTEYTHAHAAACVACLPVSSALFASENPDYAVLIADLPVKAVADALAGGAGKEEEPEIQPLTIEEYEAAMAAFGQRG